MTSKEKSNKGFAAMSEEEQREMASKGGKSSKGEKEKGSERRGFASMSEEQRRKIASKGGEAAHEKGTAHEFTSEEARIAGKKGGEAVSADRRHMAEIGRKGGEASGHRSSSMHEIPEDED